MSARFACSGHPLTGTVRTRPGWSLGTATGSQLRHRLTRGVGVDGAQAQGCKHSSRTAPPGSSVNLLSLTAQPVNIEHGARDGYRCSGTSVARSTSRPTSSTVRQSATRYVPRRTRSITLGGPPRCFWTVICSTRYPSGETMAFTTRAYVPACQRPKAEARLASQPGGWLRRERLDTRRPGGWATRSPPVC